MGRYASQLSIDTKFVGSLVFDFLRGTIFHARYPKITCFKIGYNFEALVKHKNAFKKPGVLGALY